MVENGTTGVSAYDCHWERMKRRVDTKLLAFGSSYNASPLFRNLQNWCRDTLDSSELRPWNRQYPETYYDIENFHTLIQRHQ